MMNAEATLEAAFEAAVAKALKTALGPRPDRRFGMAEMLDLADRAVARIDLWGQRGVTGATTEEIAAMACVIALSGAVPALRAQLARAAAGVNETTKQEATAVQ